MDGLGTTHTTQHTQQQKPAHSCMIDRF